MPLARSSHDGTPPTSLGSRYRYSLVEETLLDDEGPPQVEAGAPMDEDAVVAMAAEYGTRIVGPPIGPC